MFNTDTRKWLVEKLRPPVRMHALRALAEEIMRKTQYRAAPDFIHALLNEDVIREHRFKAKNGRTLSLYSSCMREEFSPYTIAFSLFPNSYFCNLTAIYHHGLTNQVPGTVYVCNETIRPKKTKTMPVLSDSEIRSAFIKPHRHTRFVVTHQGHDVVILDRERGSDHGVVAVHGSRAPCPAGSKVTSLERALIDAVVAPQYNGGITSLPAYFTSAKKKLKIKELLEIYGKLGFVYPYSQALGFFLQHAGMSDQAAAVRRIYPPHRKFYADHSARASWNYDERWMIYYPGGLVDEH